MSDEAARKRAVELREQIAALRKGEKPKPESIRDAVNEAAKKAGSQPPQPPDDCHGKGGQ